MKNPTSCGESGRDVDDAQASREPGAVKSVSLICSWNWCAPKRRRGAVQADRARSPRRSTAPDFAEVGRVEHHRQPCGRPRRRFDFLFVVRMVFFVDGHGDLPAVDGTGPA